MTTKSEQLRNLTNIQEQIEGLKVVSSSLERSYSKSLTLNANAHKEDEDFSSIYSERAAKVVLSNSDAKKVVGEIISLKEVEYDRLLAQVLGVKS